MNIEETRNFLTMLWSLFPNAPRSSSDEKKATVAAWFYVLHEYSIGDVWIASQKVLYEKPVFIPTAYEILSRCHKTTNPERFLGDEYAELEKRFTGCTHIYQQSGNYDYELLRLHVDLDSESDEGRQNELRALILQNTEQRSIERRMDELFSAASNAALREYDNNERNKYSKDLIQLGFAQTVARCIK